MVKKGLVLIIGVAVTLLFTFNTNADAGLVSWWKFDETEDRTADDSQTTNNGTLVNFDLIPPNGWTTDTAGGTSSGALSFDGLNDYVEILDSTSLDITDAVTVEAWVKFNELKLQQIVAKINGTDRAYYLFMRDGFDIGFKTSTDGTGATSSVISTGISFETGKWYHLVGTYDNSAIKLYIDGDFNNSATGGGALFAATSNLYLGQHGGNAVQRFNGTMDEVKICDQALTAGEIDWNYKHPGQHVPSPATFMLLISGLLGMVGLRKRLG